MRGLASASQTRFGRTNSGSALMDFSAALIVLVCFAVPLLDLTIVPIRWMLAQELVNGYARRLSLCETFSASHARMNADPSLRTKLQNLGGVSVESINLHLRITRNFGSESVVVDEPGKVPAAWLPNGANAPCTYVLELDVKSLMSPAILVPLKGVSMPGLTKPIPLMISASHEWANCGANPATEQFFLNE